MNLWIVTAGSGLNGHWVVVVLAYEPSAVQLAAIEHEQTTPSLPGGWEGLKVTKVYDTGSSWVPDATP